MKSHRVFKKINLKYLRYLTITLSGNTHDDNLYYFS